MLAIELKEALNSEKCAGIDAQEAGRLFNVDGYGRFRPGFGPQRLLSLQRYEPQDILMVFLSMQYGLMLPETDAHFVTFPDPNHTLLDFYQLFGDEILESQGNVGLGHNELNPNEFEKIADHMLEKDIITGVKETGLIVSPNCSVEKREINWGLAMYKLRQGDLVFSDIKDQLVAALRQTSLGPNFLKATSA